jgi:hypothetical protein
MRTIKSKLPKSIKRITILKADGADSQTGSIGRVVVKKKRKKKKQSKGLVRIWERAARGYARSNRRTADEYLSRHRRSSKKRRDGWLRDLTYNWGRASRKGNKQFKLSKIFR